MYIKKKFPIKDLLLWSYRDMLFFLVVSGIPVALYTLLDLKFLRLPWLPIAVLGTALAFIIGFKNNTSYDRYWEARKIWGGIVNSSRSWAIMVRDFINNKHAKNDHLTNDQLAAVKIKLINRHIAWMAAHRYSLRTSKPWESSMDHKGSDKFANRLNIPEWSCSLEEALTPLLDPEELTYVMSKTNKATTLISLQSKHLKELEEKGHIWEFSYLELEKMLVEFYTLQGKNERIKNFPYPRQFATLNFYFIWTFIFLLPFGVIGAFDELGLNLRAYLTDIGKDSESFSFMIARNFTWLTVPFCVIISWVFNSMDVVGQLTENPFEGTPNDIPISTMSRGIEIDILEILDAENIPEPIPTQHHIQL
ncbi:MAG: putative membrane protein [Crocinitomicaceae bacterium]|jgi:putative membrane protein